jgi:hypothetical protein
MKMRRRLFVSLTDEQWHFVAMNRRGSMPAFVRQLVDEAIARDRERYAPQFRQFALIEKVSGIAEQREAEAKARESKQEARKIAKRNYMRRKRAADN